MISAIFNLFKRPPPLTDAEIAAEMHRVNTEIVAKWETKFPPEKYTWHWPSGEEIDLSHGRGPGGVLRWCAGGQSIHDALPDGVLRWTADGGKLSDVLTVEKQADGLWGFYETGGDVQIAIADRALFTQADLDEIFEDLKRQRKEASKERQAEYDDDDEMFDD